MGTLRFAQQSPGLLSAACATSGSILEFGFGVEFDLEMYGILVSMPPPVNEFVRMLVLDVLVPREI